MEIGGVRPVSCAGKSLINTRAVQLATDRERRTKGDRDAAGVGSVLCLGAADSRERHGVCFMAGSTAMLCCLSRLEHARPGQEWTLRI